MTSYYAFSASLLAALISSSALADQKAGQREFVCSGKIEKVYFTRTGSFTLPESIAPYVFKEAIFSDDALAVKLTGVFVYEIYGVSGMISPVDKAETGIESMFYLNRQSGAFASREDCIRVK